jgi:putative acetyltransferase
VLSPIIRESGPSDLAALESMYPRAFPDEDLVPLLRDLLPETDDRLSLVASIDSHLVGHVLFTRGRLAEANGSAALLGPLAVSPDRQRRGIGGALVREGLDQLGHEGVQQVFVLGDLAYYGRFGFAIEKDVLAPYELPAEWATAWQSLMLGSNSSPGSGKLMLPGAWMRPELWMP